MKKIMPCRMQVRLWLNNPLIPLTDFLVDLIHLQKDKKNGRKISAIGINELLSPNRNDMSRQVFFFSFLTNF